MTEEKKYMSLVQPGREKHYQRSSKKVRKQIQRSVLTAGEYLNLTMNLLADASAVSQMPTEAILQVLEAHLKSIRGED